MDNFNEGNYKKGNESEVKSARIINRENPLRFRLDRLVHNDLSAVFERLVDTRTHEEIMEWSIVEQHGQNLIK